MKKHTISILLKNEAGALSRVSDLFSGRGYNIESLTVAPTQDVEYSKITVITSGDDKVIEQIMKQLHRLIPVIKVTLLDADNSLALELLLVKVELKDQDRADIIRVVELFGAKILDISQKYYTIQAVGDEKQMKSMIELLRPLGIKDMVRSGMVGILRG